MLHRGRARPGKRHDLRSGGGIAAQRDIAGDAAAGRWRKGDAQGCRLSGSENRTRRDTGGVEARAGDADVGDGHIRRAGVCEGHGLNAAGRDVHAAESQAARAGVKNQRSAGDGQVGAVAGNRSRAVAQGHGEQRAVVGCRGGRGGVGGRSGARDGHAVLLPLIGDGRRSRVCDGEGCGLPHGYALADRLIGDGRGNCGYRR